MGQNRSRPFCVQPGADSVPTRADHVTFGEADQRPPGAERRDPNAKVILAKNPRRNPMRSCFALARSAPHRIGGAFRRKEKAARAVTGRLVSATAGS
jgi:hypothetical protein